jgi:hypothetical protein
MQCTAVTIALQLTLATTFGRTRTTVSNAKDPDVLAASAEIREIE